MTLGDIKALVVSVDPNARHYFTGYTGGSYTCWQEVEPIYFKADNRAQERGISFEVIRITREEEDPIAAALETALNATGRVSFTWRTEKLYGTEYIRHLFTCQAV